jgi:hypothetical protein
VRIPTRIAALLAVLLSAATALAGELTIDVARPFVRPGQVIRARVAWSLGVGAYLQGTQTADWKLTDGTGRVINYGRRTVHVGWAESDNPPYRFTLRAPVPRGTARGGLVLSVLVHYGTSNALDDFGTLACASVPLLVSPRGVLRLRDEVVREGKLVRDGPDGMLPTLGRNPYFAGPRLYGTAVSEILANPAYDGATVRLTTRELSERDLGHIPEDLPDQEVTAVEWIDPPAAPVGAVVVGGAYDRTARLRSRIPPADLLLDPLSWRAVLAASRAPSVLRTLEEFDAFALALRPALDGVSDPTTQFADTDFAAYDVIAVFTGTTPDDTWRVAPLTTHRDERTQTTWVRYAVVGASPRAAVGTPLADACCLFRIPKFAGEVRVQREEWIPRPPRWW